MPGLLLNKRKVVIFINNKEKNEQKICKKIGLLLDL